MFSPCEIEVLIHYCTGTSQHARQSAPAVGNACNRLCLMGLLEPWRDEDAGPYRGTEKGKLYLEMLCAVPPPRRAWLDHNGNVLRSEPVAGAKQ